MGASHQRLLHFLGEGSWDDRAVRLAATRYALEEIEKNDIFEAWIIDDTGFLKNGSHSVGVQRQGGVAAMIVAGSRSNNGHRRDAF